MGNIATARCKSHCSSVRSRTRTKRLLALHPHLTRHGEAVKAGTYCIISGGHNQLYRAPGLGKCRFEPEKIDFYGANGKGYKRGRKEEEREKEKEKKKLIQIA